MHGYGHGMAGWGYLTMTANTILLLLLVAGGAALLVHALRRPDRPTVVRDDAAQRILAERYARGEIDDEEYQKRTRTLRGA